MQKRELGQFYTKDTSARYCTNILIDILKKNRINFSTFLEPSGGDGVFLRYLKEYKVYSYDIDPKTSDIQKLDFLTSNLTLPEGIITIGNPPFGKRSKLAIDFINKSFEYSKIVAFILPIQFRKYLTQKRIRSDARLVLDCSMPLDGFLFNSKDYQIRTTFQVWTTLDSLEPDTNLRIQNNPPISHEDFEMFLYNGCSNSIKYFSKEEYKWDFAVPRQGYVDYTLRIQNEEDLTPKSQYMFFRAKSPEVLKRLLSIDFVELSKKNTTIFGYGKADVVQEYTKLKERNA